MAESVLMGELSWPEFEAKTKAKKPKGKAHKAPKGKAKKK